MVLNVIKKLLIPVIFICVTFISVLKIKSHTFSTSDVIITEIMYNPAPESCEYVELYNRSTSKINLKNWRIGDYIKKDGVIFTEEDFYLYPNNYIVVSEDSTLFYLFPVDRNKVIIFEKLPGYNNDDDLVIIYNSKGITTDSVYYCSDWGGEKGRSLERKILTGSSDNEKIWGTCTEFTGGTPGGENSIFYSPKIEDVNINLTPEAFFPNGDGYENNVRIEIEIPFDRARINVKIFDRYARPIRTLLNGYDIGQKFSVFWNGKKNNGNFVKRGIYIILIDVLSEEDKYFESFKRTVAVHRE